MITKETRSMIRTAKRLHTRRQMVNRVFTPLAEMYQEQTCQRMRNNLVGAMFQIINNNQDIPIDVRSIAETLYEMYLAFGDSEFCITVNQIKSN